METPSFTITVGVGLTGIVAQVCRANAAPRRRTRSEGPNVQGAYKMPLTGTPKPLHPAPPPPHGSASPAYKACLCQGVGVEGVVGVEVEVVVGVDVEVGLHAKCTLVPSPLELKA